MNKTKYSSKFSIMFFICFILSVICKIHESWTMILIEMIMYCVTPFICTNIIKKKNSIRNNSFSDFISNESFVVFLLVLTFVSTMINTITSDKNIIHLYLQQIPIYAAILLFGYELPFEGNDKAIKAVEKVIVFFMLGNAIYSVIEHHLRSNIFEPFFLTEHGVYSGAINYRVASMFVNPIPFGTALIIGIWITIDLKKNSMLCKVYVAVMLLALYYTKSRSAWLSLLVCFILYCIRKLHERKLSRHYILLLLLLPVVITSIYLSAPWFRQIVLDVIERFSTAEINSVSKTQRLGSIYYIFQRIYNEFDLVKFFIGHGAGESTAAMLQTTIDIKNFSTTDNQFVTILYDYGLIPLLSILYYMFKLIKTIITTSSKTHLFICLSVMGYWLGSFFYESLIWSNVYFIGLFLMGVELCLNKIERMK